MFQQRRSFNPLPLIILIVVCVLAVVGYRYIYLSKPQISGLDQKEKIMLANNLSIDFWLQDPQANICEINGVLSQGEQSLNLAVTPLSPDEKGMRKITLSAEKLGGQGFKEGDVKIMLDVKDCRILGRSSHLEILGIVDLLPPQVAITSTQHYVNQGGADVVTYRVSDDTVASGVKIGQYVFNGSKMPKPDELGSSHFTFFVYSYEYDGSIPIIVFARDAAGNESQSILKPARFFNKDFRHRELSISDDFIQEKVRKIIADDPHLNSTGDLKEDFILVNNKLRAQNTKQLLEWGQESAQQFYWKDAFSPMGNASVEALYADYRTYLYNNEKIDQQVHLGFDLANFRRQPILASNAGVVVKAENFGIYGNTIILDHGYGIMTLYAHLTGFDVKVGDYVERNQKIANSGETGLAGGDHLHFSMLIHGVQTNPIEFWDQHWIDDHVYLRLPKELFGVKP